MASITHEPLFKTNNKTAWLVMVKLRGLSTKNSIAYKDVIYAVDEGGLNHSYGFWSGKNQEGVLFKKSYVYDWQRMWIKYSKTLDEI